MYTKTTLRRFKTKITLMETLAKNVNSLDDLVFENRNKSYGAYAIRKGYNNSLAKAFGATALLLMLMLFMATRKPEAKDLILVKPPIPPTILPKEDVIPLEVEKKKLPDDAGRKASTGSASRSIPEYSTDGKYRNDDIVIKGPIGPVDRKGEDKGLYEDDIIGDGEDTTGDNKGKGGSTLVPNDKPVYIVQDMPTFPGGEAAMMKFIAKEAAKNKTWVDMGLTGTINVQFIVNADGSISNVQALNGNYEVLKKVAVNAVKAMPNWKPGMQDKRAVPVILVVPISFKQI